MALALGSRIGPYEITGPLGAGGMGEVYRAKDSNLGRDVAIKILPATFAEDPERIARFEREAKVLASLNHPNIAIIHGLERVDSLRALVMEFVDGETLADRIARGPLPVEEALTIARQMAEALAAAHDRGIIHRDLKPANVKVRPDGTAKVLDFGLAKALEPADATGSAADSTFTVSTPAALTRAGMLLGTAAYMSPEQAKGRPADKRSDIWAFGCVVYEMLTAERPFAGEGVAETIANVLKAQPDWTLLPREIPDSIKRILKRSLEKDPKRRLDSAAVARVEIEDALAAPDAANDAIEVRRRSAWHRPATWLAVTALLALVAVAMGIWTLQRQTPLAPRPITRFAIALPAAQSLALSINDRDLALSTDGTRLAYTAGDQAQLMVQGLDQLEAVPVSGIVNARAPFLSPDARWIGFFDRLDEAQNTATVVQRGELRRVSTSGGRPTIIASVTGASRGASWSPDDSIVFATSDPSTGLLRVPAGGGEPEVLTRPNASTGESDHYFPSVLPEGRGVLFTVVGTRVADRRVAVLDLTTGQQRALIRSGSQAQYVESGHLIYADVGTLWATRFDLSRLDVVGEPVPLIESVLTVGATEFSLSHNGSLVYVPIDSSRLRSLVWVGRQGTEESVGAPPRPYVRARLSPDGARVALQVVDQVHEVTTWDFALKRFTRLTFGPVGSYGPAWTPDGRHIIYGSARDAPGISNLYRRTMDGTGPEERLTTSTSTQRVNTISPDGTRVVFEELTPSAGYDLKVLVLPSTSRVEALLATPFDERDAVISPDGRWMAYESNESGQSQIYVRPFPAVSAPQYQISYAGGRTPLWAHHGRELYFVNGSSVMAAAVQLAPTFGADNPTKLFEGHGLMLDARFGGAGGTIRTYDVSRDGRFLMIKETPQSGERGAPGLRVVVVQNWIEEVKAKLGQ